MKHLIEIPRLASYLYKNWFWVSLVCLLIYAFVKRDMEINVSTSSISLTTPKKETPKEKAVSLAETNMQAKQKVKEQPMAKGSMQMINPFSYFNKEEEKEIVIAPSKIDNPEIWYTATEKQEIQFIKRFEKIAIKEMKLYGIPASIKLAQGLIGSKGGQTIAAKRDHNFFQVPCKTTDQETSPNCLKKYKTAWMGFRDHSDYITEGQFKYLVKLGRENYHQWAKGLEMGGYDQSSEYDERLIAIIEKYELYKFDKI